jgi:hypothetical protein
MPKINEYVNINNKKPVETVYEIKGNEYQIPSFEEFIKSYQADEKVNYADLESGGISEVKGYGPCSSCVNSEGRSFKSNGSTKFRLEIELKNAFDGAIRQTVYSVKQA